MRLNLRGTPLSATTSKRTPFVEHCPLIELQLAIAGMCTVLGNVC